MFLCRVCSLEEELQSLLPRIADASRAANEAQVLTEMEACLQELEVWLVSSGKFAPNQHILQQIQEHKVRSGYCGKERVI